MRCEVVAEFSATGAGELIDGPAKLRGVELVLSKCISELRGEYAASELVSDPAFVLLSSCNLLRNDAIALSLFRGSALPEGAVAGLASLGAMLWSFETSFKVSLEV